MKKKGFLKLSFFVIFFGLLVFSLSLPAYSYYGVLPYEQQLTFGQTTPFFTTATNKYLLQSPTSLYGTQSSMFSNMFANYSSKSMVYSDLFSQAAAKSMNYSNIFGVSMSSGQGYYRDPLFTAGGAYSTYASPFGSASSDVGFTASALGGSAHLSSSLRTPWTSFSSSVDTAYGMGVAGYMPASSLGVVSQYSAFGTPTVFNFMGINPDAAGQLAVSAFSHEASAMNQYLSNQYMYTPEGMPFIANASYYNPDSYGGSNWYFPAGITYSETGVENVGGYTSGYNITQQIGGGYGALGASVGAWSGSYTGGSYAGSYGGSYGGGSYGGSYGGGSYGGSFGTTSAGGGGGGTFTSGAGNTYGGAPGLGW